MTEQITPEDIESKFRDVQDQVTDVASSSKKKAILAGGVVAFLLVVFMYLMGRRSGKRKSTVMEIRRF